MNDRWIGLLVRQRPTFTAMLAIWPNVGVTLITIRSLLWFWAGWPIVGTIGACGYAYVLGTHWKLSAFVFGFSFAVDLVPSDLGKLLPDGARAMATWAPRLFTLGLAIWSAAHLGWPILCGGAFAMAGLIWVEQRIAKEWCVYDLWRVWCQVRRRGPLMWHSMAGKTESVQGAGRGGEVTLARGFSNRPWLDHPAFNFLPIINCLDYTLTGRTFSPPGRDMGEYKKVLSSLSSDDPYVARLTLPSFEDGDTATAMVITCKRRGQRRTLADQMSAGVNQLKERADAKRR